MGMDFNSPPGQPLPALRPLGAAAPASAPQPTGGDPFAAQPAAAPGFDPFAGQQRQAQVAAPPQYGQSAGPTPPEFVDTNDMQGGFSPLPDGSYQVRLATCSADMTKGSAATANRPVQPPAHMVTVTMEVVNGPLAGRETRKWYILTPTINPRTQKWNSRGIAEAREDIKTLGFQPPDKFPTNAQQGAQIIGMALQQAGVFTIVISQRSYKDASGAAKSTTDTKIVRTGGVVTPAAGQSFGL